MIWDKLVKFITYPIASVITALDCIPLLGAMIPDDILLKCRFLFKIGETLDLKKPKNFNQKIQWIKLYDRNPLYTKLTDKHAVRKYITEKAGEKYLIPLLWAGDKFDDINFDELPDQFVIKCNHDSGSAVICKDKNSFDHIRAKKKIERKLKKNYYHNHPGRQWQYKNIVPKIIIEKYLANASGETINEYKIFCFNGTARCIGVYSGRLGVERRGSFFDIDWNILPFTPNIKTKKHEIPPNKPEILGELITLSEVLSKDALFVRVDFYVVDNTQIMFGELTFTPHNGFFLFNPPEWNKIFGDWLILPNVHTKAEPEL